MYREVTLRRQFLHLHPQFSQEGSMELLWRWPGEQQLGSALSLLWLSASLLMRQNAEDKGFHECPNKCNGGNKYHLLVPSNSNKSMQNECAQSTRAEESPHHDDTPAFQLFPDAQEVYHTSCFNSPEPVADDPMLIHSDNKDGVSEHPSNIDAEPEDDEDDKETEHRDMEVDQTILPEGQQIGEPDHNPPDTLPDAEEYLGNIEEIADADQYINLIENATLHDGHSCMDDETLEHLLDSPQSILAIDDPNVQFSICVYLSFTEASEACYKSMQHAVSE
ncbi:hypothetical protein OE88DRAFT_1649114 [Heliocybe sulcata]|uniref:Uncharacterized protein n=1 Tax=Heliocybe sulcata TaxID=5364 RepID=A0A5C3MW57_9AGAM|nr:hypothetical protein OE88DRAFT_1649114 [Heliocybe sulcata]